MLPLSDKLTIVLTLRGRHLHTLRWMWHANRLRLPFHVIIADGEVEPTIERLLADPATFPNVSYEYHRYDDRSFSDFYRKSAESMARVRTPYVMICDNDDFLLPSGLLRCIAFLDENPDFVCASGGIAGFATVPTDDARSGVVGPLNALKYRCHDDGSYDARTFEQPAAADRVLDELRHFLSIYYSVYRIEAATIVMREIQELDFSDLLIHEFFAALRTLTLGKVSVDGAFLSYARQDMTSSFFPFTKDWVDHLLKSRLPHDFRAMAHRIATEATRDDPTRTAALEEEIHHDFAAHLRRILVGMTLRQRFPRLFQVKQRLLRVRSRFRRPRAWRMAAADRQFWQRLAADGASPDAIADHRREFAEIRDTLENGELTAFMRAKAPALAG